MSLSRSLFLCLKEWMHYLLYFLKLYFKSSHDIKLENIALRSQLALYIQRCDKQKLPKPTPTPAFRQLWLFLSMHLKQWKSHLILVKPDTVIKWHRTAFTFHWKRKSRKVGRPKISRETIHLIKRVHQENPLLSPEKIHEKLKLLGIEKPPVPNTISKYLPSTRQPPTEKQMQSWKTFLKNHQSDTWATDFFTIPTLTFDVLYGLVIIHHQTRKIIHFEVTTNPTAEWMIQQFRNATPYGKAPKYLIHDNDSIFRSKAFQRFLTSSGITTKRTAFQSPWQNPYAERVIGTLRRELLDHIIPLNETHLEQLLTEYIEQYYNTERTHQGINGKTPVPSPEYIPTDLKNIKIKATPVLNGLYHTYKRVA
ncbi:Integrase core domain-containing protein [Alteribacillus persepolensis]|uniref:Integrase core domain-containing protein n=1 Tax=Alteribacillus persepolensis TaxID=568899 RepID=A0A1G8H8T6_9BACI|nr:integrase core domain-containing protein [Alteribacillus persepolensis]SDI02951.1 Integrase core domain-containing protein [Alteribacillus persepolensis]